MTRQKRKKRITPSVVSHNFTLVILVIFFSAIGLWLAFSLWHSFQRPRPESSEFVMKHLPPDIAKELRVATPSATYRIPILLYHYVEYVKDPGDTIRKSLNTTPDVFENHIKTLIDAKFAFLKTRDIVDILARLEEAPQKSIVLTFDDGYRDFYTDVFPILKKYKVKATVYVVSGFLDSPNYLLKSQLLEIARSGLVEIGAHTVHHVNLKGISQEEVQEEVVKSREMLEQILHTRVLSFAYPYGGFDKETIDVVKKAGFTSAASTILGDEISTNNQYFLYRIRPGNRIGAELLYYLEHIPSEAQNLKSR